MTNQRSATTENHALEGIDDGWTLPDEGTRPPIAAVPSVTESNVETFSGDGFPLASDGVLPVAVAPNDDAAFTLEALSSGDLGSVGPERDFLSADSRQRPAEVADAAKGDDVAVSREPDAAGGADTAVADHRPGADHGPAADPPTLQEAQSTDRAPSVAHDATDVASASPPGFWSTVRGWFRRREAR